jgi:hypothetical protein
MRLNLLLLCLILLAEKQSYAQACCSGGAPISFNLVFSSAPVQTFQFALSYDYNNLGTLLESSNKFDDNNRIRTTQSVLLNVGYTFTSRFAVDAVIPYVVQTRKVYFQNNSDYTVASGIGDLVLLPKILVFGANSINKQLQIGAGIKAPTGKSDIKINQIALNADMQPGSGSWDIIFMANYYQSLKSRPSIGFNSTVNFIIAGTNKNYLGEQEYKFGNDFYWLNSISDQLPLKNAVLSPTLGLRYRIIGISEINDTQLDNTGGQWLTAMLAASIKWNKLPTFNVSAELPLYNKVNGIQLSTSYRFNVGIQQLLNLKK